MKLSLNQNHCASRELLCARQCLIKQAYQSLLSLNQNHCASRELLRARQCLIKQAYQSLLSLNQHFLTVDNVNTLNGILNTTTIYVVDNLLAILGIYITDTAECTINREG